MTQPMSDEQRIAQLLHSANNCRQMLAAVDRKLAEALQHVYDGDIAQCRDMLEELSRALPEAMAIIEFEEDMGTSSSKPASGESADRDDSQS